MATSTVQTDSSETECDKDYNGNADNVDTKSKVRSEATDQLTNGPSEDGESSQADQQKNNLDPKRMEQGEPLPRCPSPAAEALDVFNDSGATPDLLQEQPQACSTPIAVASTSAGTGVKTLSAGPPVDRPATLSLNISTVQSTLPASQNDTDSDSELGESLTSTHTVQSQTVESLDHELIEAPILGYEVMEQRARFTVFKIHVRRNKEDNWFIFRRYTDFVRLNDRLREMFPYFRLALPPKKWFGDNFDRDFVEDRMLGLQAFINNVIGHRDICNSETVRDFFCFDDPPGPHDSLEESRAKCEALEDQVYNLARELQERDAKMALMEEEIALHKMEIENLRKSLRIERSLNNTRHSPSSQPSECSLTEQDQASCVEADQVTPVSKTSSRVTSPDVVSITPSSDWDATSNGGEDVKMSKMKGKDLRNSRKNSSQSAHSSHALYQPAT